MADEIEIRGSYEPRFEPVAKLMRKQLRRYGGGAAAAVFLRGEPVVDIWAGSARRDGTPFPEAVRQAGFDFSPSPSPINGPQKKKQR